MSRKIPGSKNIPLYRIDDLDVQKIKDKQVILICRTHNRSQAAYEILKKKTKDKEYKLDIKILENGIKGYFK